jgi:hypothetical protein
MKKLIVAICFFIVCDAEAQQVKPLQFKEELFDFGLIVEQDGPVLHQFEFTNVLNRPVKVLDVKPSCGCTTPAWSKEPIMPGKTGFIQAQFDPKGRPGFFTKTLSVTTDADGGTIVLQIRGNVTGEDKSYTGDFSMTNGNWKIKPGALNLGKIYLKDEFVTREIEILNAGTKTISYLNKADAPAHIKVTTNPVALAPGARGVVKIAFNGKLKNHYGFQSDKITLYTDDADTPQKSFTIFATLEDYFPALSSEEMAKAPKLRLSANALDFGRLRQHQTIQREITVSNSGKSVLELRSVQGNCDCVTTVADKKALKPGESTLIKISFNPEDRKGTQQKAVTIYSNDPQAPVQRFTFTAYVED